MSPYGVPLVFALANSLGLRLFFTAYISSCNNKDTTFQNFIWAYCWEPGNPDPKIYPKCNLICPQYDCIWPVYDGIYPFYDQICTQYNCICPKYMGICKCSDDSTVH